jgi:hypothetical protein
MALSTDWMSFATATVAAPGVSVPPSVAVPDNCQGILVTNPSATVTGLYGMGVPGGPIVVGPGGGRIPPGASISLPIGTQSRRGVIDQGAQAGSGPIFDAIGGAVTLELTYLNVKGAS